MEKTCPAGGHCPAPADCDRRGLCPHLLLSPIGCLHFVGFRDDRYWNAVRAFGLPDIIHCVWDERARREVGPDDVVVFAEGDEHSPTWSLDKRGQVRWHSWDDSHEDIVARGGPRDR